MVVTQHEIDLDDQLLASVQELLGTESAQATVYRSLEEVRDLFLRREHVERLTHMEGLDLDDPEVMRGAWREDI